MKINEIAIIIAEKEDKQFDLVYLEMLKERIRIWRNTILRQSIKANPFDINYYLHHYTLDLEKVNSFKHGYDTGEYILKSVRPLYKPLRINDVVEFIGSIDFVNSFGKVDSLGIKSSLNRKYTKGDVMYDIRNNYVYIFNALELPVVGIISTLEYPEQIELDKNSNLTIDDIEFKCSDDVIQKIIQAIWSEDLRIRDKQQEEHIPTVVKP